MPSRHPEIANPLISHRPRKVRSAVRSQQKPGAELGQDQVLSTPLQAPSNFSSCQPLALKAVTQVSHTKTNSTMISSFSWCHTGKGPVACGLLPPWHTERPDFQYLHQESLANKQLSPQGTEHVGWSIKSQESGTPDCRDQTGRRSLPCFRFQHGAEPRQQKLELYPEHCVSESSGFLRRG